MKTFYLLLCFISLLSACDSAGTNELNERKEQILEEESNPISERQLSRKERSNTYLKEHNIKVNENLPCIADDTSVVARTKEEILDRALCLLVVSLKAEGLERSICEEIIEIYNLDSSFTPDEQRLLNIDSFAEQDKINALWKYESINVLLWSLGMQDSLGLPSTYADPAGVSMLIKGKSKEELLASAKLRTSAEIFDQADLIYRLDWVCVDARVNSTTVVGIDSSVCYERHYSLNWLIRYMNQDWDSVSTDT